MTPSHGADDADDAAGLCTASEHELFTGLRAGGASGDHCRAELVARYTPMASALANRYRARGEDADDLRQIAFLGLLEALARFDPDRGIDFPRFAVPTILGLLRRHFRDDRRWVRLPRRLQELAQEIREAQEVLAARNAALPTQAELAAHLDVPVSDVEQALLSDQFFAPLSLDAPVAGQVDGSPLAERLGALDDHFDRVVGRTAVLPLVAALPDRERDILISTFWHEEPQTSIGRRWGVSQMQISRLLTRTLRELREKT